MLGLPKATEIAKQLPKKAIFQKFELKPAQRDRFDADISKMTLVNAISQATVPALQQGEKTTTIYVLEVVLKKPDYDPKNLVLLGSLINQKMLFVLHYESQLQLAIYYTKLLCGSWMSENEANLSLTGTTVDAVWDNWVLSIGGIEVEKGNTLIEQIAIDDERTKLLRQIETLEKKARAEKQPRRKLELFEELQELKKLL